jgi:hypothetical protein
MAGIITLSSPAVFTVTSVQVVFGVSITWTLTDANGRSIIVTVDLVANTFTSPFASGPLNSAQLATLAAAIPAWLANSGTMLAGTAIPGTAS